MFGPSSQPGTLNHEQITSSWVGLINSPSLNDGEAQHLRAKYMAEAVTNFFSRKSYPSRPIIFTKVEGSPQPIQPIWHEEAAGQAGHSECCGLTVPFKRHVLQYLSQAKLFHCKYNIGIDMTKWEIAPICSCTPANHHTINLALVNKGTEGVCSWCWILVWSGERSCKPHYTLGPTVIGRGVNNWPWQLGCVSLMAGTYDLGRSSSYFISATVAQR